MIKNFFIKLIFLTKIIKLTIYNNPMTEDSEQVLGGATKLSEQGRVTVPKEIREEKGFEEGDKLLWYYNEKENELKVVRE